MSDTGLCTSSDESDRSSDESSWEPRRGSKTPGTASSGPENSPSSDFVSKKQTKEPCVHETLNCLEDSSSDINRSIIDLTQDREREDNDDRALATALQNSLVLGRNDTRSLIDSSSETDAPPSPKRKTSHNGTMTPSTPRTTVCNTTPEEKKNVECAWTYDRRADEYFLSKEAFQISGVEWPNLRIPAALYDRLYDHQKVGVQWMSSLHLNGVGGILGDDMGLGKTYQTLAYLGGLMRTKTIRTALVVAPVSVLRSWEREAKRVVEAECVPNVHISVVSSSIRPHERARILQSMLLDSSDSPSIAITTFGLVTSSTMDFVSEWKCWDYVILDEGHKIKNSNSETSRACHKICRNNKTKRLLLTGTPIQNNMKELWALFDWACSGRILGTIQQFQRRYGKPIEAGRDKLATPTVVQIAEKASSELQTRLLPHFLQRMKTQVMDNLPRKQEFVVWTHLSEKQRRMYQHYLDGEKVASVMRGEVKSPLEAITWLKKLCGHPLLVEEADTAGGIVKNVPVDHLLRQSTKLEVLSVLVSRLSTSGHRTIIFSQSTKILDMIQLVLDDTSVARIDGSTKEVDRQRLIDEFNRSESNLEVMLLSTKAGGLGLTLTGADRAIIYDPSWNPAEDAQAVDRCYRIGQKREVKVFRFIAAGTVEEKMLEKQVHKDGIRRAVMTSMGTETARYFAMNDLRKMFTLGAKGECAMLEKIQGAEGQLAYDKMKQRLFGAHPGMIGVSSYDCFYNHEVQAVSSGSEPFGGKTPSRWNTVGRSQRVLKVPSNSSWDNEDKENPRRLKDCNLDPQMEPIGAILTQVKSLRKRRAPLDALDLSLSVLEQRGSHLGGKEKFALYVEAIQLADDLGFQGNHQ